MKKVILPILGGIGNQYFQLSALKNLAKGMNITVDSTLFIAQSDREQVQIGYKEPPSEISFHDYNRLNWLSRRVSGILLRIAHWQKMGKVRKKLFTSVARVAELILTIRYNEKVHVIVAANIGYEVISLSVQSDCIFLLGYFQSYRYHSTREDLGFLQLTDYKDKSVITALHELAISDRPMIVHVRRGDYKNNPQIGLLSRQYYLDLIPKVFKATNAGSIWFFTNDHELGFTFIPESLHAETKLMNSISLSDLEILEIMKLGHAYLLANSTYSWWAAYLSNAPAENIFIPDPWFANAVSPSQMSPEEWNRVEAIFE